MADITSNQRSKEILKDFLNKMCNIKKNSSVTNVQENFYILEDLRSTSLNALMTQFIPMNAHSKYWAAQNSKEIGQHCNLLSRAALKDAILIKNFTHVFHWKILTMTSSEGFQSFSSQAALKDSILIKKLGKSLVMAGNY